MPESSYLHFQEFMLFLVAAGIAVPTFQRLQLSPVLGYLLTGVLIGPFGLGLLVDTLPWLEHVIITDLAGAQILGELGVVFLLFMIGLELSLDRLWAMRRLVFGLGSLQVLTTTFVIALIAWVFGNTPAAALVLGACLALSSTAIVMQLLTGKRQLGSSLGRTCFAILLMQDLAVVPILFLVGVLGAGSDQAVGLALLLALLKGVLIIAAIYVSGRILLRPLFNLVAHSREPEMFMAAALLVVMSAALVAGASGLSMGLGAFLAGLLLADTEFRHEIEVNVAPFKGLLLGTFFMSVGMGIDARALLDDGAWLLASMLGLIAIKALIIAALVRLFGLRRGTAVEAGLLLAQGGEFALVVVGLAISGQLLDTDTGRFMISVTGLTMLVTPLLALVGRRLALRIDGTTPGHAGADLQQLGTLEGHVVIAGFGRVGQLLARILDADNIQWLALDTNASQVATARQNGLPVYYGDASRLELLKRAHAEQASVVVLTMDSPTQVGAVLRSLKGEFPRSSVVARARDGNQARRLLQDGASAVVPETLEAGLQMAGRVLQLLGTPEDVVLRRLETQRDAEQGALRQSSD